MEAMKPLTDEELDEAPMVADGHGDCRFCEETVDPGTPPLYGHSPDCMLLALIAEVRRLRSIESETRKLLLGDLGDAIEDEDLESLHIADLLRRLLADRDGKS
jgi:hypothetical protein